MIPKQVKIVEVGPRDGLQNEATPIHHDDKLALIDGLADAGLRAIEAGSFVNPKWVPQMAGSGDVFAALQRRPGVVYSALTPNLRGFEQALAAGVDEVAVFAAASEGFSRKNINCSVAESLQRFEPVMVAARAAGVAVRAYVSCVIACPYDGRIDASNVLNVTRALLDLGCYEVSLGDTVGQATPADTRRLLDTLLSAVPVGQLAAHFHDTYGQALANTLVALDYGIATIDSSVAGLGGCPYARGASGNLATEDLVYMLNGMDIEHGVNLDKLIAAGNRISAALGRRNQSKVAQALTPPPAG